MNASTGVPGINRVCGGISGPVPKRKTALAGLAYGKKSRSSPMRDKCDDTINRPPLRTKNGLPPPRQVFKEEENFRKHNGFEAAIPGG
jgi:hypothetical protein